MKAQNKWTQLWWHSWSTTLSVSVHAELNEMLGKTSFWIKYATKLSFRCRWHSSSNNIPGKGQWRREQKCSRTGRWCFSLFWQTRVTVIKRTCTVTDDWLVVLVVSRGLTDNEGSQWQTLWETMDICSTTSEGYNVSHRAVLHRHSVPQSGELPCCLLRELPCAL